MQITLVCGNCQAKYRVDATLAGKRVKCKHCGEAIVIPAASVPQDQAADLVAGHKAASQAEKPHAAAPAAVQAVSPCPGCGRALPASHRICTACGYDRAVHRKVQINVAVTTPPEAPLKPSLEHTGFLAWLDATLLLGGQAIFWLWALYLTFVSTVLTVELARRGGSAVPLYSYAIALLGLPILLAIWALGQVQLTALAVILAGRMMRFEMPSELRWRVLSSQVIALTWALIGWLIVTLVIWARNTQAGLLVATLEGLALLPFIALVTSPLAIPTHFFSSWLLLRVRFVDGLIAWLFQCISITVFGAVLTGISIGVALLARLAHR